MIAIPTTKKEALSQGFRRGAIWVACVHPATRKPWSTNPWRVKGGLISPGGSFGIDDRNYDTAPYHITHRWTGCLLARVLTFALAAEMVLELERETNPGDWLHVSVDRIMSSPAAEQTRIIRRRYVW